MGHPAVMIQGGASRAKTSLLAGRVGRGGSRAPQSTLTFREKREGMGHPRSGGKRLCYKCGGLSGDNFREALG